MEFFKQQSISKHHELYFRLMFLNKLQLKYLIQNKTKMVI